MSMKVYNGYRLKGKPNLKKVLAFSEKLRDKITPVVKKMYRTQFMNEMLDTYDKNQFGFYNDSMYFMKDSTDLFWAVEAMMRARMQTIKITQRRDPQYDYDFSYSIHPHKNGSVLVLLYTERSILTKVFEKMPEIEDYHYQDNSDKPKEIPTHLWNKRKDDWNSVLGGDGYGIPVQCGFTYTPYDVERLGLFLMEKNEKNKLVNWMASIDERAKNVAGILLSKEWETEYIEEQKLTSEISTPEQLKALKDAAMDRYWKYVDFKKTPEGQKRLQEKIELIKPQLKVFTKFTDFDLKLTLHPDNLVKLAQKDGGKPYWYIER